MITIEEVATALSNAGLKEVADIARHSDDVDDFMSYMQSDIEERRKAMVIVQQLEKNTD